LTWKSPFVTANADSVTFIFKEETGVRLDVMKQASLPLVVRLTVERSATGGDTCFIPSSLTPILEVIKIWSGRGDRTRNIQLGNQNYCSFIFTTYKTA
jgi:hypothetical protein